MAVVADVVVERELSFRVRVNRFWSRCRAGERARSECRIQGKYKASSHGDHSEHVGGRSYAPGGEF